MGKILMVRTAFILILTSYLLLLSACARAPSHARLSEGIYRTTKEEDTAANVYFQFLKSENFALDGSFEKARLELEEVIKANPEMGYLYYERAVGELDQKNIEAALADCERALKLSPQLIQAKLLLARLYSSQEKFSEAIAILEETLKEFPGETEAYVLLTREYITTKRYKEGAKVMQRLLIVEPGSNAAYFYLGMLYGSFMKDYPKALSAYQKILEVDPENIQVRSAIAQIYLDMGQKKKAIDSLLDMEDMSPNDLSIQLKIALLYYQMKNYNEAVERFENILEKNPESDKIRFYLGVIYSEAGDTASAIRHFKEMPAKSDYFRDANLNIAQFYLMQNREDEAVSSIEAAMNKKKDPAFYVYLSSIYERKKDYGKVRDVMKRAAQALPDNEVIAFGYAVSEDRAGDKDAAVKAMRDVLKLNPKNAKAMNYIGYVYADEGERLNEAEVLLQDAAAMDPEDGYILDSLGWLYFKKGDLTRAEELLKRAARLVPKEVDVHEHLGALYEMMGDARLALSEYRKALKLAREKKPPDEAAIKRLEERIAGLK